MLIGVHILRDHPQNFDSTAVHNAIYSVSAITATVIMTIALYNGYHIRYHKGNNMEFGSISAIIYSLHLQTIQSQGTWRTHHLQMYVCSLHMYTFK